MNPYFRAIGFSKLDKRIKLKEYIKIITNEPDKRLILGKNNDDVIVEYHKSFGDGYGIVARGIMDEKENVRIKTCHPYNISTKDTACSSVEAELINGEYLVISEDENSGNEVLFQLQNVLNYLENEQKLESVTKVNISGLSLGATIILPVAKDEASEQIKKEMDLQYVELVRSARNGDHEALELLSLQELETSEIINERLQDEDFLSVVEGYYLPVSDNDSCYSVLGDIETLELLVNPHTNEETYRMSLDITGTKIDVCINTLDLVGCPTVGMRFMGTCWLQGQILF